MLMVTLLCPYPLSPFLAIPRLVRSEQFIKKSDRDKKRQLGQKGREGGDKKRPTPHRGERGEKEKERECT